MPRSSGRPIKACLFVPDVLVSPERGSAAIEVAMIVLVILSTATLGVEPSAVPSEEMAVNQIEGTLILSTASSMDALGLANYERGAIATVRLTVRPAESSTCGGCNADWTGLNIEGEVNITELFDEAGRLGRIEASINITYLVKRSSSDFISSEWLLVDWDAGDASSHSEILIVHDPPRWIPADRIDSSFVSRYGQLQTRTGPHITIEEIGAGMLRSSGCLPDSFTCSRATRPDIDLVTSSGQVLAPLVIDAPSDWQDVQLPANPATSSDKLAGFRSVLDVKDPIERQTSFCPWTDEPVLSTSSWMVMDADKATFTPLASHLSSLGLPVASIHLGVGTWTEVDLADRSCGALIDDDGQFRLGFATN
jgi:hypothetical protein